MQRTAAATGFQQRLGRRLGLEPYYSIAERSSARLRLESRPEANRTPGRQILAGGIVLLVAAALVAFSGLFAAAAGVGFAAAALGAVVGGLLGALGYQRGYGGYAVLTTRNSVVAAADTATVTFTQSNRVAPERSQRLPFEQIVTLRLRRRPYVVGTVLRRTRPVVALELVAQGENIWIIDSAEDPERLRTLAEGLSEVLGMELARA